jgi:hypothetical protein
MVTIVNTDVHLRAYNTDCDDPERGGRGAV